MTVMRVHLGSDHAGLDVQRHLQQWLSGQGYEVVDHGPAAHDPEDDYPVFCLRTAEAVVRDQQAGTAALGIVIGGSGNGEQIAANKVAGARAALAWNDETARLAREHNDANVLGIGARNHPVDDALRFVEIFVTTPFSREPRHVRRITQLEGYETTGTLPGLE